SGPHLRGRARPHRAERSIRGAARRARPVRRSRTAAGRLGGTMRRLLALGMTALAFAGAGGAARTPTAQPAARAAHAREILIGAVWPWQTRSTMLFGQGLELAVDEINTAGGVDRRPIRIVREDDRESLDEGRLAAQRIAANLDLVAVIGHLQ